MINFNFGIQIDHYIQIDFCAFRRLVQRRRRDRDPVPVPGPRPSDRTATRRCSWSSRPAASTSTATRRWPTCAAVTTSTRIRPAAGNWVSDPTSDFGRITRQQDFLRRVLVEGDRRRALRPRRGAGPDHHQPRLPRHRSRSHGAPHARVRQRPQELRSRRRSRPTASTRRSHTTSDGAKVEIPQIKSDNMQAILAVFRGEATLASAPEQEFDARPPRSPATHEHRRRRRPADCRATSDAADAAPTTTLPDGRGRGERGRGRPRPVQPLRLMKARPKRHLTARRVSCRRSSSGSEATRAAAAIRDPSTRQRRRATKQETQ